MELRPPVQRLRILDFARDDSRELAPLEQLAAFAAEAGLSDARVLPIPRGCWADDRPGRGDRIPWLALVATKPDMKSRVLMPGESRETRGTNGKRNDSRE